jgi:hypothetical protein
MQRVTCSSRAPSIRFVTRAVLLRIAYPSEAADVSSSMAATPTRESQETLRRLPMALCKRPPVVSSALRISGSFDCRSSVERGGQTAQL